MQDCNVFVIHGHMVIVTRYHESQSQFDKLKVIPSFLPWREGRTAAGRIFVVRAAVSGVYERVVQGLILEDKEVDTTSLLLYSNPKF